MSGLNSEQAILLTGILTASACALLGSFLILRRTAMMADAISHAILPGIVLGYFLADGPQLFAGFLGAALASTVTVFLVGGLQRTRKVDEGSAIGIVFPAMFALGTVVVSKWFANVHLDTDAVLYGNIEFTNFDRWFIGDRDMGPLSIWVMGTLLILNLLFLTLFYKELKLTTFDGALAVAIGFSPALVHYALMSMLSVTTVGAFTAVGAILVIALVIVPAATAYLLTERLGMMIALSVLIGALSAVTGYQIAIELDASISGSIVMMTGVAFLLALFFSPSQGMAAKLIRRRSQRDQFSFDLLLVHLSSHRWREQPATRGQLPAELAWSSSKVERALRTGERRGLLNSQNGEVRLTAAGVSAAASIATR